MVLPRNNIGIDVVHVSSLDEGLTWGIHIFFFWKTHTKNHDFWPGQNVNCKISRKSADHHHPEGANRSFRQPLQQKHNMNFPEKPGTVGTTTSHLLSSHDFLPRWTFSIIVKKIETKSGEMMVVSKFGSSPFPRGASCSFQGR